MLSSHIFRRGLVLVGDAVAARLRDRLDLPLALDLVAIASLASRRRLPLALAGTLTPAALRRLRPS